MRWFWIGLLIALSCTGISRSELTCEQAVSRITSCCPEIDPRRLACVESEGGCTSGKADPMIDEEAGACILDRACDDLRASGKCGRIERYSLVPDIDKDRAGLRAAVCQ